METFFKCVSNVSPYKHQSSEGKIIELYSLKMKRSFFMTGEKSAEKQSINVESVVDKIPKKIKLYSSVS